MEILFCILIGYFIGCINPAYILGKVMGKDVKNNGSGNAGASNALILFGKFVGVFCALFDIFKAWGAIELAEYLFSDTFDYAFSVTAVAAILGHIFPFYIRFSGGKGLASFGGMVLSFSPLVFLVMFSSAIVMVLLVNYICFVPMVASVVFPVIYGVMRRDLIGALILCIPIAVIFIKHKENIKRIANGTEFRISYLWNKNKELERVNLDFNSEESNEPETANEAT